MIFLYSPISSSKSIFGIVVITSPCPCWISAALAAAFFCTVLLLVLHLVSVVVLWFALPAVGVGFALLPAVGFALLPAVGFALLGSFHHRYSSSRCPRTIVALLRSCRHRPVGCGSVSRILTTCSLAVVPSVLVLQSHFVVGHDSVGVLGPREGGLQQRVLLYVRSGLRGSLYLLLVGVRQYHCVVL